jgi:hypothetical protein
MGISLRLAKVELRKVRWKKSPDRDALGLLQASVQVEGLLLLPTLRQAAEGYRILSSGQLIECLAALVETNAICRDHQSGRWVSAVELYLQTPAWLIELDRCEEPRHFSRKQKEREMLTYVLAARALQPPLDGTRLAREMNDLSEDLAEVFPPRHGFPNPLDLSRKLSLLTSAQIAEAMRPSRGDAHGRPSIVRGIP